MSDQKTCSNGHLFDDNLDVCPYCPAETVVEGDTQLDTGGDTNGGLDKTEVLSTDNPDRTLIHKAESEAAASDSGSSHGRKLVGWLVTFTWNKEGQDYQLREGKTLIGADNKSDIILGDSEVSAHHCTILYRSEKFRLKDEFSTNGTLVNDIEIDTQVELNDGDKITVGKTELLFRAI